MLTYKSTGTLRFRLSKDDGGTTTTKVIFIPAEDFSVKYNGKDYAIFAADNLQAQLKEYQPKKRIGIDVHVVGAPVSNASATPQAIKEQAQPKADNGLSLGSAALQAAKDQALIEIEVEPDGTSFNLVGLTIPAK